jgi:hypothetical protein
MLAENQIIFARIVVIRIFPMAMILYIQFLAYEGYNMITLGVCVLGDLFLIVLVIAIFCGINRKKDTVKINGHPMDRSDY